MSQSLEAGLRQLEQELRRVASMPPISGGAPISAEFALERIIEVVSNISPSGGAPDLSAIAENVLPATDDAYDLGSDAKRWNRIYLGQLLSRFVAAGPVNKGYVSAIGDENSARLEVAFDDATRYLTVVVDENVLEIYMVGLPTADPVDAGALWNDNGTLKVSAG